MTSSSEDKAAGVQGIVFDVDGVLTSGAVVYGPGGEWKVFDVQDGHGFKLARRAGLKLALLSGRASDAVTRRAEELQVDAFEQGIKNKVDILPGLLEKMGIEAEAVCYVGDDLVDIPPMRCVGFRVAVANAVEEVKAEADWITTRRGGQGAAREVIERILKARGWWQGALERYVG